MGFVVVVVVCRRRFCFVLCFFRVFFFSSFFLLVFCLLFVWFRFVFVSVFGLESRVSCLRHEKSIHWILFCFLPSFCFVFGLESYYCLRHEKSI